MPDIDVSKSDLPFLLKGSGTLTVHASVPTSTAPLAPTDSDLLSVDFGVKADPPFTFGASGNLTMDIKGGTSVRLVPLFPSSSAERLALLKDHGLDAYFGTHSDAMLLGLLLDASADVSAAGSFTYSVLSATASLDVGGAAGYVFWHPFPASTPLDVLVEGFFAKLRLPGNIEEPPPVGEVIAFDYNGYLGVGAGLSVGYELKGAPSFKIGDLLLSEHYQLSVIGKLGLNARIAGEFAVEVRAAVDDTGAAKDGWARVIVHKKRDSKFQVAADVDVEAQSDLEGLPGTGDEFLSGLLGVGVKNWLNVLARVRELSDLDALKSELDGLAQRYLEGLIGKGLDALSKTEFNDFLKTVEKVVDDYENLDNSAITLFDRYFDKLDVLTEKLDELAALASWDKLKGEINSDLWEIVRQLTDGDPLNWILGVVQFKTPDGKSISSLDELKQRVQETLDLVKGDAHSEIRNVITLAKSKFPLDHFLGELNKVDSIAKLEAFADTEVDGFVHRLVGNSIDELAKSDAGKAIARLHEILVKANEFENKLYDKFKDAAHQAFSFKLHAEYSRASERDALVDVEINLKDATGDGKKLMRAAGRGDFQDVLAAFRPEVIRINSGVLTHKVTKESLFNINVVGWHRDWNYSGLDRVIVATEQQIVAEKNGGLSVYSAFDLTKDKDRQRAGERTYTNFLMRFLGESHGALQFDKRNQQYLVDVITSMSASYTLGFEDDNTRRSRLEYYLSFAQSFDLAAEGATVDGILPMLTPAAPGADNFGQINIEYQVRYTEAALRALFTKPFDEDAVRKIMRKIVLANYLRNPGLADTGWCYWTPGIFNKWKEGQAAFTNNFSLTFSPVATSPFGQAPAPDQVTLKRDRLFVLSTLFFIEENLVDGLKALDQLVHGPQVSAQQFEKALSKVGDALKQFDDFDEGVNTVFAVLDQLVALNTDASAARDSSLTLDSFQGGHKTQVFVAGAQPADAALEPAA